MQLPRALVADQEVGGALDAVELVQVVGQGAGCEQPLRQLRQRLHLIVDPGEQHRLVEHGGAGAAHARDRRRRGRGQLVRMVGMDDQHALEARSGEPAQEGVIDALGQHHRQAGMHAQPPQLGDGRQLVRELGELGIGQGQGIAAGEDQLVHAGIVAQVGERRLPPAPAARQVLVGELAAEAVAAVHRAGPGGHQQGAAGVLVQQPGRRAAGALAQRIGAEAGCRHLLGAERQDLAQQGVSGIAAAHQGDEGAWHQERELPAGRHGSRQQRRRELEQAQQLGGVAHRLGEQAVPAGRPHGGLRAGERSAQAAGAGRGCR